MSVRLVYKSRMPVLRTLSQRIRHARTTMRQDRGLRKLTLQQVGDEVGVAAASAAEWEKERDEGGSEPTREKWLPLAQLLEVNPMWLIFGIGLPEQTQNGTLSSVSLRQPGGYIVTRVEPIEAAINIADAINNSKATASVHKKPGPNAFYLSPWDDSCAPRLRPSHGLVVDRDIPATPGRIVFAGIGVPRRPVLGRLVVARDSHGIQRTIRPLNSAWPDEIVGPDDEIIGVVDEHSYSLLDE